MLMYAFNKRGDYCTAIIYSPPDVYSALPIYTESKLRLMQYHTPKTDLEPHMVYINGIASLNFKSIPSHARLVLVDQRLALLGGIVGFGEQHAVISGGLFGLADTARLLLLDRGSEQRTGGGVLWASRFGKG